MGVDSVMCKGASNTYKESILYNRKNYDFFSAIKEKCLGS